MTENERSRFSARITLVLAAVLWSSGSFFMRSLAIPSAMQLDEPRLPPLQIAFWRSLFAGLVLIPLIRKRDVRVRPIMLAMMICFATMSGLYLTALGTGSAANAILLQNTAPVWVYIIGVLFLGHAAERGSLPATILAMIGAGVIMLGNWPWNRETGPTSDIPVLLMGAGSGLTYAGVVLFLGGLKHESPAWLMLLNLLGSTLFIGVYIACFGEFVVPTGGQIAFLALFGAVQMALPYWLFARGLKYVSAQEAGIITLLEPVLNPVWAYLLDPVRDTPTIWTLIGGGVLLAALGLRYYPRKKPLLIHGP